MPVHQRIFYKRVGMVHLSEDSQQLTIRAQDIQNEKQLLEAIYEFGDVCFLRLPIPDEQHKSSVLTGIKTLMPKVVSRLRKSATLIIYGDVVDLVHVHEAVSHLLRY